MHINDAKAREMDREMRSAAQGKLACECGNDRYEAFLFVSAPGGKVAACKRCGRAYINKGGTWALKGGPAPAASSKA